MRSAQEPIPVGKKFAPVMPGRRLLIGASMAVVFLAVFYTVSFARTEFEMPLNTIITIKYFEPSEKIYAYRPLVLTPVEYRNTPLAKTLVAKALYRGETIGLEIVVPKWGGKVVLKSIGEESGRFAKALSELYEENFDASHMREEIMGKYLNSSETDWLQTNARYKVSLDPAGATMELDIDIPGREVTLGDRHNGLAKKRFVNAFVVAG